MALLIGTHFEDTHNFQVPAILPGGQIDQEFMLSRHIEGAYGLIFFYSLNFGFVCPTELLSLSNRLRALEARNIKAVIVSCESYLSHLEWRNKPVEFGGIGDFPFPLVSDSSGKISEIYECLVNDSMPLRASFVIDPEGYFRYQSVQDYPVGRNIDEIIRVIDGLRHFRKTGEFCPAGWTPERESLPASHEALSDYMVRNASGL